jgi:mRNA interferase MazF
MARVNVPRRGVVIDLDLEPVTGSEAGKVRPCVVVTNNTYNERVPVIQVVPATAWSEKKGRIISNVVLEPPGPSASSARGVAQQAG